MVRTLVLKLLVNLGTAVSLSAFLVNATNASLQLLV